MVNAKKVSSTGKGISKAKSKSGGNKKGMSTGAKAALVGASIIAAGAAAYYLSDKKRRAQAKDWMVKMKGEAIKKFKGMGSMSKEMYMEAIDKVAEKYRGMKNASPAEIAGLVSEMKKHWTTLSQAANSAKKSVKKSVKKAAKKVVKKASAARA